MSSNNTNNPTETNNNNEQIQQYNNILDNNENKPKNKKDIAPVKANVTSKRQVPVSKPEIDIDGVIATNWSFGKREFSNDEYYFKTLRVNIPDPETGEPLPGYTIGQYIIKPKKRTMWLKYNKDALYFVDYGDAWFLVGKAGSAVDTGYWLCVPENTEHIILNSNPVSELRINLVFPGAIVIKS